VSARAGGEFSSKGFSHLQGASILRHVQGDRRDTAFDMRVQYGCEEECAF
jgi:hypothetical protein